MIAENFIQTIQSIKVGTTFKILGSAWIVVFMPVLFEIKMLAVLVLLDTLTGSMVAIKNKYFNAKRLSNTAYKLLTYMILIGASLVFESMFATYYETNVITMFIIGVIAITEFLSILENLSALGLPIPDVFNTFFKDINHKGINVVISNAKAKRRIARNLEILMNKYLLLIHSKDSIQLLEIKFKLWIKNVVEPILNNKITNINSFNNKYNLMVQEARLQLKNVVKQHKNLEDEYQRFGKYSEEQIFILNSQVEQILLNQTIPMEKKHIKIAEIHADLLYKTFNEVLVLEHPESSRKEYLESD